jgi:Domain of unknown function (DUF4159)
VIDKDLLQSYPIKRLKPIDGLSVTADVWSEAHDYHRLRQRYHALLAHGFGLVAGLEVVASDPADNTVYIMPGMAISPTGEEIVLAQPVAYDLGKAQDMLYLLLTFGESKPAVEPGSSDGARLYVYSGFEVEAKPAPPGDAHLEIARINRVKKDAPISNAANPEHPQSNEIDQRYRLTLTDRVPAVINVAVVYASGFKDKSHGAGLDHLTRVANRSGLLRAAVDTGVSLSAGLDSYELVHLVGQGAFQMSPDDMTAIYNYVQAGGTVYIESSRKGLASGEPAADGIYTDLVSSFGLQLADITVGHELLTTPNLFAALPPGYETQGKPRLQEGGGVIFSTYDYANLWQGERRGGPASREEIRTAHEFGINLLAYAHRRRMVSKSAKNK